MPGLGTGYSPSAASITPSAASITPSAASINGRAGNSASAMAGRQVYVPELGAVVGAVEARRFALQQRLAEIRAGADPAAQAAGAPQGATPQADPLELEADQLLMSLQHDTGVGPSLGIYRHANPGVSARELLWRAHNEMLANPRAQGPAARIMQFQGAQDFIGRDTSSPYRRQDRAPGDPGVGFGSQPQAPVVNPSSLSMARSSMTPQGHNQAVFDQGSGGESIAETQRTTIPAGPSVSGALGPHSGGSSASSFLRDLVKTRLGGQR